MSPGNGRYALVPSVSGSNQQYQLLDNRTGVTGVLVDARATGAVLSPDGCFAAAAMNIGPSSDRNVHLAIIQLDDPTKVTTAGIGFSPVWLLGSAS